MKSQKPQNTTFLTSTTGQLLYTGEIPKCFGFGDCSKLDLNQVNNRAFELLCFLYNENNSLSNVNLLSFTDLINCKDKNLPNLFNLTFSILHELRTDIDGFIKNGAEKIQFDFKIYPAVNCEAPDIFLGDSSLGSDLLTVKEVIQLLINRANSLTKTVCTHDLEIQAIKDLLEDFGLNPTETIDLSCIYWDGIKYIPAPNGLTTKQAVKYIDKDICKVKGILGNATELKVNRDYFLADPDNPGSFFHTYSSSTNSLQIQNKIQQYLADVRLKVQTIEKRLDACCKTNCDLCVQGYFNNIINNYGTVALGSGVAYITLDHFITTQAADNCTENSINLSKTMYTLSDGKNSISITLDNLAGVTVMSGNISNVTNQSARLRFNLTALNLDYLSDITIRLKTFTSLGCDDSYRVIIPRFDNPSCDVCEICFTKSNPNDPTDYTASFTLNYTGGSYAPTSVVYNLSTANPCISIDKKMGQTITVTNFSSSAGASASMCTTCAFLTNQFDLCCGSSTESETFLFQIPTSHMAAFAVKKLAHVIGFPGAQAINFDISGDDSEMFIYDRIITTFSPAGDPLSGNTFNIARPSPAQYPPTASEVSHNNNDIYIATPKPPSILPAHVSNICDAGGIFIKWDYDSAIHNMPNILGGEVHGVGGDSMTHTYPSTPGPAMGPALVPTNPDEQPAIKFKIDPRDINNPHATLCMTIQGQQSNESPFIVLKDRNTNGEIFIKGMRVNQCNC